MTTLSHEEIAALANQIGGDAASAIVAFEASAEAWAVSFRHLRAWQGANQDQAKIVSDILMQREANLSMNDE